MAVAMTTAPPPGRGFSVTTAVSSNQRARRPHGNSACPAPSGRGHAITFVGVGRCHGNGAGSAAGLGAPRTRCPVSPRARFRRAGPCRERTGSGPGRTGPCRDGGRAPHAHDLARPQGGRGVRLQRRRQEGGAGQGPAGRGLGSGRGRKGARGGPGSPGQVGTGQAVPGGPWSRRGLELWIADPPAPSCRGLTPCPCRPRWAWLISHLINGCNKLQACPALPVPHSLWVGSTGGLLGGCVAPAAVLRGAQAAPGVSPACRTLGPGALPGARKCLFHPQPFPIPFPEPCPAPVPRCHF